MDVIICILLGFANLILAKKVVLTIIKQKKEVDRK